MTSTTRYTRKDAEACFERLLRATGHRKAASWDDVGGWALDYNGVYGGFVVAGFVTRWGIAGGRPASSARVCGSPSVPLRCHGDRGFHR